MRRPPRIAQPSPDQPARQPAYQVEYRRASSLLTKASGFVDHFDYTLNPYSGCTFGCHYCYAAFFARTDSLQAHWGKWVHVKENALALLAKYRAKPLIDRTIYMSSVTDPYQPIERDMQLTRAILQELLDYHQVRLVIQTRGPLVTRDLDLLRQFRHVQVNMTITTDDETVRRAFEPTCPANAQRIDAIRRVTDAGIQTCITMTPLLPVRSPDTFADSLLSTGVSTFVVQAFHTRAQRFVASTGDTAIALAQSMAWDDARYAEVVRVLRARLPNLREGKDGFVPIWDREQQRRAS